MKKKQKKNSNPMARSLTNYKPQVVKSKKGKGSYCRKRDKTAAKSLKR